MALSRLAWKNLNQRVLSFPPSSSALLIGREVETNRHCSTEGKTIDKKTDDNEASEAKEVITSSSKEPKRSKSLFSWNPLKRGIRRSRNNDRHFVPSLFELMPSGLGNALMEASENMNKVLEKFNVTPWSHLSMRVKEQNDCYKLRFDVPGLRKEDLKVGVEDGVLVINGETNKEDEKLGGSDSEDDESFYSRMYGYYHTSLALPEDAKVDGIRAELKDGVLRVVVPRDQDKPKKELKHVQIH